MGPEKSDNKEPKFLRLSEIADGLSILTDDHDQKKFVKYMSVAPRVYRELYYGVLGEPTRIFLKVDPSTKTVRLPHDFYQLCSLAVLDRCIPPNVIPLAFNSYLNTVEDEPDNCAAKAVCCECKGVSPICDEVSTYQTITETITLPDSSTMISTTRIKTCANGDIIQETCAPTFVAGTPTTTCNYEMNICLNGYYSLSFNPTIQQCIYAIGFNFLADSYFPMTVQYFKNCVSYSSGVLANRAAFTAFMASIGFVDGEGDSYSTGFTNYVFGNFTTTAGDNVQATAEVCNTISGYPYYINDYSINGVDTNINQLITSQSDLDDFMTGTLGLVKINNNTYQSVPGSSDVLNYIAYSQGSGNIECDPSPHVLVVQFTQVCPLSLPVTIVSYTKNALTTTINLVINNQGDLDNFFSGIGFIKNSNTDYSLANTSDIWNNMLIGGGSNNPQIISFIQSNCQTTTPDGTYQIVCVQQTKCNVPVKPCGCIIPSPETEDILAENLGGLLQSCCNGNVWFNDNGRWRRRHDCATPIEKPFNREGTYNLDTDRKILLLDFNLCRQFPNLQDICKVLISYKGDGAGEDGNYWVPDYPACVNAVEAGINFYSLIYDRTVADVQKLHAERFYDRKKFELHEFKYPLRMEDLIAALNAKRKL